MVDVTIWIGWMLSKEKARMVVGGLALNIPLQSILLLAYRNVDNLSSIFLTIVENEKNSSLTDFKVTLTILHAALNGFLESKLLLYKLQQYYFN